jgi:pyruvate dehydrogenase E2 component (dihydrolipoamide acetyltransferase)
MIQDVLVPDIGDYKDVPVIDILVKPGDRVEAEAPLVTLESDKATMDVPAPAAGVVKEIKVKVGDKVSQGVPVVSLETDAPAAKPVAPVKPAVPSKPAPPEVPVAESRPPRTPPVEMAAPEKAYLERPSKAPGAIEAVDPLAVFQTPAREHGGPTPTIPPPAIDEAAFHKAHAGPGVRKLARELGVDLARVRGTGPKNRILQEDVHAFVKSLLSGMSAPPPAAGVPGLAVAPWPKVDFAKFGPVETKPLTRIQKIAGPALHRNWVTIPHVTSCEDADITELEAFRVQLNKEQEIKVTLLAFLVKACVSALQKFPDFNSSLDGDHLVIKRYWHVGFAADTPQGLLVPVIKDADKKGVLAIAQDSAALAAKAREGKLAPGDMQGATFSISSLGGIGGTYFTPIINAPEVAILGVCRASMRPVWNGSAFAPRLVLPLSLSWDHRVVDGAAAGRFNAHLAAVLADARRILL